MGILIKIKTNAPPCKHTVVTVTEDGVDKQVVFHDSDFENKDSAPDQEFQQVYKVIKNTLIAAGSIKNPKKLSASKALFDGKTLDYTLTKEAIPL